MTTSTPQPPSTPTPQPTFDPVAGVLAALLPGLGHLYQGHARRAGYIALGVLGLFFSGLLVGGIDSIDSREDRIWFMGQALVGPLAFAVDHVHQTRFKVVDARAPGGLRSANPDERRDPSSRKPVPAEPGEGPPNDKSLAKVNELGTLFSTVAGLLNLIVILDALLTTRRRPAGAGA
jgi:hypothetical protein